MKRLSVVVFGLLLLAAQFVIAPTARAADLGRAVGAALEELSSVSVQRRALALCLPYSVTIPGPSGGELSVSGEGCPNSSGMSLTTTMTYSDYGVTSDMSINGSATATVELVGDITAGNVTGVTVVINGGPLTYSANGESYTVEFTDFTVEYTDSLTPVSASGGVTINGVYYPASVELAGYII